MKNKLGIWKDILGFIVLSFLIYAFIEYMIYIGNEINYKTNDEISAYSYKYIDSKINCSDDKFDKKKMINDAMSDNKIIGYEYLEIIDAHAKCEYKQNKLWWKLGYWKYYMNTKMEAKTLEEKEIEKKRLQEEKSKMMRNLLS